VKVLAKAGRTILLDRRGFLTISALAGAAAFSEQARAADSPTKFAAIAFDAFPIFDPRPVAALCEALFPGKGSDLVNLWRARQFEYCWLRIAANRYADFESVTEDSLAFAVEALKLEMTAEKREQLLRAHFELRAWPDALPVLAKLRDAGARLAILSNLTPNMLSGCIKASGLSGMFDAILSTDAARTYKPAARAYQLGVDALNLPRENILFAAFAGWDAAGAKAFGYPTFWVNRLGLPPERLGALPDAVGANLGDLLAYVTRV
jgi:2-haloacid dehalogenase